MLFSSCLHEFIHTRVTLLAREAQALIRPTFTLNPLEIYDKVALVCLAVFGIIWGISPIRTDMLKSYRRGALISIAGPLLNLALAFFFAFLIFLSRHIFFRCILFRRHICRRQFFGSIFKRCFLLR